MKTLVLLLLLSGILHAQSFDHSAFDELLRKHVNSDGRVNYSAWLKTDKAKFDAYLKSLNEARPDGLSAYEKLAFWINAYNASAIDGVLRRFPTRSIYENSDNSFFVEQVHRIAGQSYSLDDIEKQVVFRQFRDARLHFVLVCAALGCPNLLNAAYRGDKVQAQLELQVARFVNNTQKVRIDNAAGKLHLSRIFEWYEKDFTASNGSVRQFLATYLADKRPALETYPIDYIEYSWKLNDIGH